MVCPGSRHGSLAPAAKQGGRLRFFGEPATCQAPAPALSPQPPQNTPQTLPPSLPIISTFWRILEPNRNLPNSIKSAFTHHDSRTTDDDLRLALHCFTCSPLHFFTPQKQLNKKVWAFSPNIRHLTPLESPNSLQGRRENASNYSVFKANNSFRINTRLADSRS